MESFVLIMEEDNPEGDTFVEYTFLTQYAR